MLTIRKLTATFGRLEEQTLLLHRGLNVISGGNETGKTTWAEFILAMFYGIDTRARLRGDRLPVKTKYLPWSGKPMAGRMELEQDGKLLFLARSSGAAPLSELTALDAAGLAVPGLNASNCGEVLLGVEAGVYRSGGFLRQQQISVSPDANLEKRLSGLVTAGSEALSYGELDAGLKKLQNEIRYNQTGELPRVQTAKAQAGASLRECQSLMGQLAEAEQKISACSTRESELQEIAAGLERLERLDRQNAVRESRAALEQAEEDMQAWEQVCAELPPAEELEALRRDLRSIRSETQTALLEDHLNPPSPPVPPEAPAFYQLNPEQASEKARQDAEFVALHLEQPGRSPVKKLLWSLPGAVLLLLGLLAAAGLLPGLAGAWWPWLAGLGAVCLAVPLILSLRARAAETRSRQEARNLLAWYEAKSSREILEQAGAYADAWALYREQQAAYLRTTEELGARAASLQQRTGALLDRFQPLIPGCDSLDRAEAYLQEAAFSAASLDRARRLSVTRRAALERLRAQQTEETDPVENPERFRRYDPAEIRSGLERCRAELRALSSEADRIRGALEQIGDPYVLNAQVEALTAREQALQRRYEAISLARETLSRADASLRARFSPLLCKRAGEIFSLLTEGRYDRVTLDREFRVRIHPAGSTLDHPLSCFSGGTVDQLYLALRLAICDLLLPGAPIILDDALVYFDDQRAAIALKALRELAKDRQILLFTCQSREKRLLDEMRSEI